MEGKGLHDVFEPFHSPAQKIRQRERGIHVAKQDVDIGPADIQVGQRHTFPLFCQQQRQIGSDHTLADAPLAGRDGDDDGH